MSTYALNQYDQLAAGQGDWGWKLLTIEIDGTTQPASGAAPPLIVQGSDGLFGFYLGTDPGNNSGAVCYLTRSGVEQAWDTTVHKVPGSSNCVPGQTRCGAVADAKGGVHVFWGYTLASGQQGIYHSAYSNGSWTSPNDIGSTGGGNPGAVNPTAILRSDGSLAVFCPANSGGAYCIDLYASDTQQASWTVKPGIVTSLENKPTRIAPALNQDTRLEILYSDSINIYHAWEQWVNGGWSSEQFSGNAATGDEYTMVANGDGRLEIFYVGTDNVIYHNYQVAPNGGWNGQDPLFGGWTGTHIAAGRDFNLLLEVIFIDMNGAVWNGVEVNGWQKTQIAGPNGGGALSMAFATSVWCLKALGW